MGRFCRCYNCNAFKGEIPPCAQFLNNSNPLIKDGRLLYRNFNRIYCFLSVNPSNNNNNNNNNNMITTSSNLQISISNFIIGLYISQIQNDIIEYDNNSIIHNNKTANDFIHKALNNNISIDDEINASIAFIISNTNAILPLYTATINITPLNLYILIILHLLENNPALFFGNNDYALEDEVNFYLSSLSLKFPFFKFKNCGK